RPQFGPYFAFSSARVGFTSTGAGKRPWYFMRSRSSEPIWPQFLKRSARARSPMRSLKAVWTSEIVGGHLCVFGRPVRGSHTNCTTSGEYSVNTEATAKPKVSGSCASSLRQHFDKAVAARMACLSVVLFQSPCERGKGIANVSVGTGRLICSSDIEGLRGFDGCYGKGLGGSRRSRGENFFEVRNRHRGAGALCDDLG